VVSAERTLDEDATEPAQPPLSILYRDEWLVAIDKPSGLLVHRSPVDTRERRFAVQCLRDQLGQRVYPAHRLDKGTSGALLFALDPATTRALAAQFEAGQVRKRYLAIVRGWPPEQGLIDRALAGVEDGRLPMPDAAPKPARTRFRRLATVELPVPIDRYPAARYALLELEPLSGRRHQLRRHLAGLAHPIVGDTTYGSGPHNRLFRERYASARLLLACVALEFAHPLDGRPIRITATPGDRFATVVEQLGWSAAAMSAGDDHEC
jgi:tRNA pseudouridine65 synthase